MSALKTTASLLARFSLCFTLIACLWIVSIRYRVGPFDLGGELWVPNNSGAFTDGDRLLLAASLALLIGLLGLYRSGRISAVLMVLVSLLVITGIDHVWSLHAMVDDYKIVPQYVVRPAIAAVLICPLPFLFPAERDASNRLLAAGWAALILAIFLIGLHLPGLTSVIGPTYMQTVFLSLVACELVRQVWCLWLTHKADLLLYP